MDKAKVAEKYKDLLKEIEKVGEYFAKLDQAFMRVLKETPNDEKKLARIKEEYDRITVKIESLKTQLDSLKSKL